MSAWVLVPKMLTRAMAQAIRDAADNRRFESWPANCWEDAIAVAPKPDAVQVPRDYDALKAENQRLLEQIENLELELLVQGSQ